MKLSLMPPAEGFFDLFSRSAANIRVAADGLLDLVENFTDLRGRTAQMKATESTGDSITRRIIDLLNVSFLTPFDREDIHVLAGNLDDVLDEIEGVANRLYLFEVEKPPAECVELVRIIVRGAHLIDSAVAKLQRPKGLEDSLVEIHGLENKADQITRRETARLFHDETIGVMNLIKWKEIYARLEHAADRMEDVADVIEDIVVKNA